MEVITNEQINNIRSSVDIVDIISSYLPLTQKGKNYFGVCPFHDDHSPSMSVSKEKQIYTCFSCGATGNVIKFVMDYENISFLEALKILSDKAGINLDIKLSNNNLIINKNKELYDIYDLAFKFYQNNINTTNGLDAKKYLNSRNLNNEVIKEFGIGLSLKNNELLTKLLIRKNYSYNDLLKSGLIVKSKTNYMDIYYNRIMFPLCNLTGQVVGFSGRIYNNEDNSKYINTKETEIFKKGELLYNYHRAKNICRQKNVVIVMEGFMDVIRAYTVGVTNVIATMGTAMTKYQAQLIKKMAREVVLCFDGDAAGEKATMSCINLFNEIGVIPKIVRLDEGLDPDEYIIRYGKDKFVSKLNNAMNVMDFKLTYLKRNKDFGNPNDLAEYVNRVIDDLNKIDDDILRELTLKKISNESNLDIDFLRSKLSNKNDIKEKNIIEKKKENKKISKYQKAEQNLIFYMLKNTDVIKMYDRKISYMPDDAYRNLAREISYFYKKNGYINSADLISTLDNENIKTLGKIEMLNLKDSYIKEEIIDYINTIWEYNLKFEINSLKDKIKNTIDPIEKAKLAQKIVDLKVRGDNYVERN